MTQEAAPIAIAERTEYGVQRQHETDCESLEFLKFASERTWTAT